mmetsp:Transcript_16195/g.23808  ORF Transcript_16195/g.23808 Transcript_16195/m.23808 type:complete len:277 (-) Transcript_16195:142-972(-)|eukprot:CAMPEP_0194206924 /NCGR_PEP_ID=MMETSP0156-20130528/5828_1 /TAXON_ID=33649 /ORGANISM="Thalassionema nitzschioides, Strain L26-B" /LENGTH=276 /DNA_ID=CAMNT_0038933577 /DNA_START=47 /DNA_END=877 /DNA_ORIENTATION=+
MEEHFERLRRQARALPKETRAQFEKVIGKMEQEYYMKEAMEEDRRVSDRRSSDRRGSVSFKELDRRGSSTFQGMKDGYYESRDRARLDHGGADFSTGERARQDHNKFMKEAMTEDGRGSVNFQDMKQGYYESRDRSRRDNNPSVVRSAGGKQVMALPSTNKQNRSGRVSGPLKKVTAGGGREHYKWWLCMKRSEKNDRYFDDESTNYSDSEDSSSSSSSDEEAPMENVVAEKRSSRKKADYEGIRRQNDLYEGDVYEAPMQSRSEFSNGREKEGYC